MDKEDTRDRVYDIPCANCSKSYVGETQRKFITRKSEHQKAVARRQGKKSALADHVIKTNHDIAWDEATILRTSNNWHQRKILEAWEINCAKDPLISSRRVVTLQGVFTLDPRLQEKMTHILNFNQRLVYNCASA